jgi:nucleoside phosphorylase
LKRSIDAILVPQGAEFAVVARACNSVPVVAIPAGAAVASYLATIPISDWQSVLMLGLCGSLDDRYRIGDVVVYRATISLTGKELECDRALLDSLTAMLTPPPDRVLALTSPHVVFRAADKQEYRSRFDARVVDMEGQTAQAILAERGIAMSSIRVVSDDSHHDLPDLSQAFDDRGRLQSWPLTKSLLSSPLAGARLVRGSIQALAVLDRVTRQLELGFRL